MKKTVILIILMLCMLLGAPAVSAEEWLTDVSSEETAVPSGICGENLNWKIEAGVLTLSGSGEMADCAEGAPWVLYKDQIEKVVLEDGITTVGAGAFEDYDKLKEVVFGKDIQQIGTKAFRSCDGLTKLALPVSFKVFGEDCLRDCRELTEIHCSGGFPSFRLNCLWNSYLRIYYPAERPWPVSLVEELESAFQGRIEFLASDGTDPYTPTEPEQTTPETTEETTQPAEASEESTAAATEAAMEQTREPETEPTEQIAEQTTEQTQPQSTEPGNRKEAVSGKWLLGLSLFTGLMSLGLLAILLIRGRGYRGRFED